MRPDNRPFHLLLPSNFLYPYPGKLRHRERVITGWMFGGHHGVHRVAIGVGDVAGSSTVAACARSRSVAGLRTTFSSVNRFRAETGGQFRIKTESSMRSWFLSSCTRNFFAPGNALASLFIDDPTRHGDSSRLVHKTGFCDHAKKRHGRHF